mmetsp:Transcript_13672/g.33198  ORF Transcript_13672/g.33198 Transcript_13672/m.33198 type:complete len:223 (-) Transcript_13672:11-679(-)
MQRARRAWGRGAHRGRAGQRPAVVGGGGGSTRGGVRGVADSSGAAAAAAHSVSRGRRGRGRRGLRREGQGRSVQSRARERGRGGRGVHICPAQAAGGVVELANGVPHIALEVTRMRRLIEGERHALFEVVTCLAALPLVGHVGWSTEPRHGDASPAWQVIRMPVVHVAQPPVVEDGLAEDGRARPDHDRHERERSPETRARRATTGFALEHGPCGQAEHTAG